MEEYLTAQVLIALLTLTSLEIVLGIDNIVFLAIVVEKLPAKDRDFARRLGLVLAMLMRILLLMSLGWVMKLTTPLFTVMDQDISARSLILLLGGLFLIAKSTLEIHEKVEGHSHAEKVVKVYSLKNALIQIVLLDLIFSLDSVITAIGMVDKISIMITAVVLSMCVMLLFAKRISDFVAAHPTVKMLAMSFLILIGVMLVMEGLGKHIEKGYIYFAMFFSLAVEMLNLRAQKKSKVA
ncbi:MAG: TerC family protein [Bdellovibrionales bacterium]